jgi:hypothetical protein
MRSALAAVLCAAFVGCTSAPQKVQYKRSAQTASSADLRAAVEGLFTAYEREDIIAFSALVSRDFRSADYSGNSYTSPFFENAVRDDFSNLVTPSFEVVVNAATFHANQQLCRLSITWFRRARVAFGSEEWIVRSRQSALLMRREGDAWKLWSIEGAPVFGLSNPSGVIMVREGEVNGSPPAAGARIENGDYQ